MARKHGKLRAMPAVRHGNARIGGTRNGGSNARYNFKSNAGSIQGFRLLSPPAEHIRVSPFQPHHFFPMAGQLDQQGIDFLLRQRMPGSSFAYKNPFTGSGRPIQHLRGTQRVVHQHFRRFHQLPAADRNQTGVSRTRSKQIDDTLLHVVIQPHEQSLGDNKPRHAHMHARKMKTVPLNWGKFPDTSPSHPNPPHFSIGSAQRNCHTEA